MTYPTSITKEEISTLPVETFAGQIVVVDHPTAVQPAIDALTASPCVGFDTETRPNFTKNQHHKVSLLQLATNDTCYLFRLNKLGGVPLPLMHYLSHAQFTKVGLSLLDDFQAIRKLTPFVPDGFVDLQRFVTAYGIQDASLQKIYAILFDKKISKRNRLTNWEADMLTEAQQQYAALDAWACLRIYQQLKQSL